MSIGYITRTKTMDYIITKEERQEATDFYRLVDMLEAVSPEKSLDQFEAAEFNRIYQQKKIGG